MDYADGIELQAMGVTFPNTGTTWKILNRLSSYPSDVETYLPRSQSFNHSYTYRVEIVAANGAIVAENIPKIAILKIRAQWSLLSQYIKSDAIQPAMAKEIRALEQLRINGCSHAPLLLDAKVVEMRKRTEQAGTSDYVTYILMTQAPGVRLERVVFWGFSQPERHLIRVALRTALADLHRCWVTPSTCHPKNLLWDRDTQKICIINFEKSNTWNNLAMTEGDAKLLPRCYEQWNNDWFKAWGLAADIITPFTSRTDGTIFDNLPEIPYHEAVTQIPVMPVKDIVKVMTEDGIEVDEDMREYEEVIARLLQVRKACCLMM